MASMAVSRSPRGSSGQCDQGRRSQAALSPCNPGPTGTPDPPSLFPAPLQMYLTKTLSDCVKCKYKHSHGVATVRTETGQRFQGLSREPCRFSLSLVGDGGTSRSSHGCGPCTARLAHP